MGSLAIVLSIQCSISIAEAATLFALCVQNKYCRYYFTANALVSTCLVFLDTWECCDVVDPTYMHRNMFVLFYFSFYCICTQSRKHQSVCFCPMVGLCGTCFIVVFARFGRNASSWWGTPAGSIQYLMPQCVHGTMNGLKHCMDTAGGAAGGQSQGFL